MRATAQERWIDRPASARHTRVQLFCFPFAGGSAAEFRTWQSRLPAGVGVVAIQLPGRANRIGEPLFVALRPLVDALREALRPHLRPPFAFFGHSMGALIAYELARRLDRGPDRLYVSGHRAPQLPARDRPLRDLPDDELVIELRRLDGTPAEVLDDAELCDLLLPRLRADFAIAETYVHVPNPLLDIPITAFGGTEDRLVRPSELRPWACVTRGAFRLRMLPGSHFFLHTARDAVLDALAEDLGE
jgi:medium-chain acyl-[acyl-carrier-protein] hydrolase